MRTFVICFGAFAVAFLLFAVTLRSQQQQQQQPVVPRSAAQYVITRNNDEGTAYLTSAKDTFSANIKQAAVFSKEEGERALGVVQQRAKANGTNPAEYMLLQLP